MNARGWTSEHLPPSLPRTSAVFDSDEDSAHNPAEILQLVEWFGQDGAAYDSRPRRMCSRSLRQVREML